LPGRRPTRKIFRRIVLRYPMLRILLLLFCVSAALTGPAALAQDGRDLTEDARKQYAQGLREASAMVKDRQFANANAKLDVLLAQRPREPQARFLKGVVQTEQGQDAAAVATFSALIADYPELPEPYNNLAVLYAQKGEFEGARIALESAVKAAPDWPVAHENLGDIYIRLGAAEYATAAKLDRANKAAAGKLALARELIAPIPKPAAAASTAAPPKQ
jgi:Flp pilus assembly protein TadD